MCVLCVLCASRTFSENDCTMVAPADPCLSPTKGELVYSKTAKQCLEEISGNAGQLICGVLFEFNLRLLLSICFDVVLTCLLLYM